MNLSTLESKLRFLRSFYQLTTEPFREIMRKIEVGEEPYVPNDREDDEQPFLGELRQAEEGLELQGQVCLTVLQRSFKEFLDATLREHRKYLNKNRKSNTERKSKDWRDTYHSLFREVPIDWDKAPVEPSTMEELTLARNCVQHEGGSANVGTMTGLVKMQGEDYQARFPDGFFGDDLQKLGRMGIFRTPPQPLTITLTLEKLDAAFEDMLAFCKYIDAQVLHVRGK